MKGSLIAAGAAILVYCCIGHVLAQGQNSAVVKQLEEIKKNAPPPVTSAGVAPAEQTATPVAAQETSEYGAFRIEQEKTHRILMILVIVAAVASLVIVLWFLKTIDTHDGTMVNATGLVLVVYGTILVVMLARADQQITAAIGIMGAVAGYLFGSTTTKARIHAAAELDSRKPGNAKRVPHSPS